MNWNSIMLNTTIGLWAPLLPTATVAAADAPVPTAAQIAPAAGLPCDAAPADPVVVAAVLVRLTTQARLDGSELRATLSGHRLLLYGNVYSAGEKRLAVELAQDTCGVEHVDDQIDVIDWTPITAPAQAQARERERLRQQPVPRSDRWIATAVRHSLDVSRGTGSCGIAASVADGVVTLAGRVPDEIARNRTLRMVAAVQGVRAVDVRALGVRSDPDR